MLSLSTRFKGNSVSLWITVCYCTQWHFGALGEHIPLKCTAWFVKCQLDFLFPLATATLRRPLHWNEPILMSLASMSSVEDVKAAIMDSSATFWESYVCLWSTSSGPATFSNSWKTDFTVARWYSNIQGYPFFYTCTLTLHIATSLPSFLVQSGSCCAS